MKKSMRGIICLLLVFVMAFPMAGCGKSSEGKTLTERAEELNKENSTVSSPFASSPTTVVAGESAVASGTPISPATSGSVASEPAIESRTIPEGKTRSLLTGKLIDDKYENIRPYAFMFNNIQYAYPQTGTGRAGIIYEILAEGGITRLMGIFDNMKGNRIGSARSARHYYVDFANEFDAIYIHYGQTKYATAEINRLGMDELSGLAAEGPTVFYRDYNIPAPHNAFASATGIYKATKNKSIRKKLRKGVKEHFNFDYENEVTNDMEGSKAAQKVTIPFSNYMTPYFTYSKKSGTYKRYAFGSVHKDLGSGKALTFTNLFIQYVNEYNKDHNGYQTMDLINESGKGYYITKGRAVKVYWKKGDAKSPTRFYYDKDFTDEARVNPGKTYYAVFPKNRSDLIKIE